MKKMVIQQSSIKTTLYCNVSQRWAYVYFVAQQHNVMVLTSYRISSPTSVMMECFWQDLFSQPSGARKDEWFSKPAWCCLAWSFSLRDVTKNKTMSLLLSTGVAQRRWLVKTGSFPLQRKLTHMKGFCCSNNSQLSSGHLPGDGEITAVFNLLKYPRRREYKKVPVWLKASGSVCGNVIHCWPGDKHQHWNLWLTKRQTVSHLTEHILEDLCSLNKGQEILEHELK